MRTVLGRGLAVLERAEALACWRDLRRIAGGAPSGGRSELSGLEGVWVLAAIGMVLQSRSGVRNRRTPPLKTTDGSHERELKHPPPPVTCASSLSYSRHRCPRRSACASSAHAWARCAAVRSRADEAELTVLSGVLGCDLRSAGGVLEPFDIRILPPDAEGPA